MDRCEPDDAGRFLCQLKYSAPTNLPRLAADLMAMLAPRLNHRGRGSVALLVKIVGPVEFEHQVAVDCGRVLCRIVGTDTARQAFDDRGRVRAVKIGDRITVSAAFVEDAVRGRQESVVRPAPHYIAKVDQERAGNDRRRRPLADGNRTASPGTSVRASAVMKLLSVCGAGPNRLSSSAS